MLKEQSEIVTFDAIASVHDHCLPKPPSRPKQLAPYSWQKWYKATFCDFHQVWPIVEDP